MPANLAWEILALVLLIVGAAFFAASEAALISVSRLRMRQMMEQKVRGSRSALRLLDDRSRLLATVLIGNTVVLLAADSLATWIFIREGIRHAAIWSTLIMAVLILLFGEIIPKTIAVANSERWAIRLGPVLERVAWLFGPINRVFRWASRMCSSGRSGFDRACKVRSLRKKTFARSSTSAPSRTSSKKKSAR